MVFKRRDKRSWGTVLWELIYPRGGWARATRYVNYRLQRLPGTPEFIARGIWAGVFISFTPFYGLHFLLSASLAYLLRGSVLAALLGTFFGNPLTYVPIGAVSLSIGYWILGIDRDGGEAKHSMATQLVDAGADLWNNLMAVFTGQATDWSNLLQFWNDFFWPFTIGGIVPGLIVATICYYISVPMIRIYQNRRKGRLRAKLAELKEKAVATAKRDASHPGE